MQYFSPKTFSKVLVGLLVFIFVFSPFSYVQPQRASAFLGFGDIVFDPTNNISAIKTAIESTISANSGLISAAQNTITAVGTNLNTAALNSLHIKEWVLDGVAFALAKMVVSKMAQATVSWINSGFQGSPMYVTDPGAFFLNVADEAAGSVLYGSDLKFLCSPINIKIALNFYYQGSRNTKAKCTISGAVGNVQGFVNGNFASGGWPSFLSISVNPSNTTMGSAVVAEAILDEKIAKALGVKRNQVRDASGFLNTEKCTTGADGTKKCVTVTPGKTISDALTFQLSTGEQSLIAADEINEIIGALFGQLLKTALTGAAGLFGMSNSGSGASSGSTSGVNAGTTNPCDRLSYLDQMGNASCDPTLSKASNTTSANNSMFAAISDEQTYQAIQMRILNAAQDIITMVESRSSSTPGYTGSTSPAYLEVKAIYMTASTSIAASKRSVATLTALETKSETGTPEEKDEAVTAYAYIVDSNTLHNSATNAGLLTNTEGTEGTLAHIEKLREEINRYTPPPPPPVVDTSTTTAPIDTTTSGTSGGNG